MSKNDLNTPDEYVFVRKIHYDRYLAVALIILLLGLIVRAFVVGKIAWAVVGEYLFDRDIMAGIVNSMILTVFVMVVGVMLAVTVALMAGSKNPVLRYTARGYMFVFRSVPILLQLLIWYNLALIFPQITIPFVVSVSTTQVLTPFVAALLAFGIAQGAYTTEVIRSGLLSVGRGQVEAAASIGMTYSQSLYRIIIPQAMRVIVPPLGNETIGMVKYTSLASVIQYREIIYSAQSIYFASGRVIEMLMVCAFWYALVIGILSIVQGYIERYYNRSSRGSAAGEADL
ncbi:polar amino acid transport system permease protein [Neorhizobium galegae]|uniref:amino acid ABC transporter permease n=1 Tax=Neorhizobium galegae TaxID=399 RepID=UPI0027875208|nr:amino acid ABC transporter permease [Neorhizobium galegae]MDQ0133829.1 polar amino acid transport system permease protein [Neorhizobium galegae]